MNKTTRNIVTAAIVGALYAVLTMVLAPISYGPVQCRVQDIRGAVHIAVFHALHDLGAVFRLRDSEHSKRRGTSGYYLRLARNAHGLPVHRLVRKA